MSRICFIYPELPTAPRDGAEIYEADLRSVMGSIPNTSVESATPDTPIASRPDIAVVSTRHAAKILPAALKFRLRGTTLLAVHHHSAWRQQQGRRKWLGAAAEKILLHLASRIVLPSPFMHATLLYSFSPDKLLLWKIPFEKGVLPEVTPERGRLIYVGTIEPRKGLEYLLQSLSILRDKHPEIHLDIIGRTVDEEYAAGLRAQAAENQLDVEFHGFLDDIEKDRLLRRGWLFAFPSLLEGFGMVLAEAQRYSLPIVSFDNSAMPYTVKNGVNGLLCPDRDSAAMARAISRILSDGELRSRLAAGSGAGARTRFSHDDFRRVVTRDTRALLPKD
ncbi:MAG: glycosyltransferase family 4 protein [Muribaculaceae bacterium]|nr:glycosyltransferase family 4 protein [Muribaculaceae bacterium]